VFTIITGGKKKTLVIEGNRIVLISYDTLIGYHKCFYKVILKKIFFNFILSKKEIRIFKLN